MTPRPLPWLDGHRVTGTNSFHAVIIDNFAGGGDKQDKWVVKMLWKQRNVKQKSETPSASYLSHCEKDFVTWKYNWLHKHRQVNFSCQEDLLPLVK